MGRWDAAHDTGTHGCVPHQMDTPPPLVTGNTPELAPPIRSHRHRGAYLQWYLHLFTPIPSPHPPCFITIQCTGHRATPAAGGWGGGGGGVGNVRHLKWRNLVRSKFDSSF